MVGNPLGIDPQDIPWSDILGTWSDRKDVILWRRDDQGKRQKLRIRNCPWYFCVTREDFEKIDMSVWEHWKAEGKLTRVVADGDYCNVYSELVGWGKKKTKNEWLTDMEDRGCQPLEGDLGREARLILDLDIGVAKNYRVAYWDIETDDRSGVIQIGKDRIISCVIIGDQDEEWVGILAEDTDEAEGDLVQDIVNKLDEYDIVVGWNSSRFDDIVLRERMKRLGIRWWAPYVRQQDLLTLFRSWFVFERLQIRRWNLDVVAKAFGFEGKVHLPTDPELGRTYQAWANNQEALIEYNREDVVLVKNLADQMDTINLLLEQCTTAGLPAGWYTTGNVVDYMLLRESTSRRLAGEGNVRFPSSYYRPEHTGGFGGGRRGTLTATEVRLARRRHLKDMGFDLSPIKGPIVLNPAPGLLENVYVVDFASMYPSTMIAFNIGLDTLVDENFDGPTTVSPNGTLFRTDRNSVLSTVLRRLIDARREYKKIQLTTTDPVEANVAETKQLTLKAITNSCYGVMAQFGRRYYNRGVAESITQGSQLYIGFGQNWLGGLGYQTVFGDTDSFAIMRDDRSEIDIEDLIGQYHVALEEFLVNDHRCPHPEQIRLSWEKHYRTLVCITKKVYAGHMVWMDGSERDELFVRGMKLLKRDTPPVAGKLEHRLLERVLTEDPYPTPDEMMDWVLRKRDELMNGRVDGTELVVFKVVSKDPKTYKSRSLHAELAQSLIDRGMGFVPGSQVAYVVTQGKPGPMQGLCVVDIEDNTTVDAYWYWQAFWSQGKDILEAIWPDYDWSPGNLKSPTKRNGITYRLKADWSSLESVDLTKG